MPSELVLFNEGLSWDARSALMQPGFLQTCENIKFRKEGQQELRPQFTKFNTTVLSDAIDWIKRYKNRLIIVYDENIGHRAATSAGDFTEISTGNEVTYNWISDAYKEFLHIVNGTQNLLYDGSGNLYPATIANPTTKPTVATGAAGSPNGTYKCYFSYLITWPNGQKYETGLSPASSDVSPSSEKIEWSDILVCPHTAVSGTAATMHRKLYRGPGTAGTLADIYLVTTITDNTTTTYSDNFTDAALAANGASIVDDYTSMPTTPRFIKYHYSRLFVITTTNDNRLYYSEAPAGDTGSDNEVLRPLAFTSTNWDDLRAAGFEEVTPQGIWDIGSYLYIPLKHTWIKKEGNDPDTWTYRKTMAMLGTSSPNTVCKAPNLNGILFLSSPVNDYPRLALFNGWTTQAITDDKFAYLFEDLLLASSIGDCKGFYDGRNYHLLYPKTPYTAFAHAVFDLTKFPNARLAYWSGIGTEVRAIDIDSQSTSFFLGCSDKFARYRSGSETITIAVKTHDLIGGDIQLANREKTLKRLYYSVKGTVTLQVLCDGTAVTWADGNSSQALTGTNDSTLYIDMPVGAKCYKYSISLTGSGTTLELYSPWEMLFEYTDA